MDLIVQVWREGRIPWLECKKITSAWYCLRHQSKENCFMGDSPVLKDHADSGRLSQEMLSNDEKIPWC